MTMSPVTKARIELMVGGFLLVACSMATADYLRQEDWGWAAGTFIGLWWAVEFTRSAWKKL